MPREKIIYRYESKLAKRFFQTTVTIIVWTIALSFLARLATAVIWYLLSRIIFRELAVPKAYIDAVVLTEYLIAFSFIVFFLNWSWANYNYYRYGRRERRRHPGYGLRNKELSKSSKLPVAKLLQLQNAKEMVLHDNPREGFNYHVVR